MNSLSNGGPYCDNGKQHTLDREIVFDTGMGK